MCIRDRIKLQVSLDADKRAIFPVYTDTLVNGVEIIDVAKPDTQLLNDCLLYTSCYHTVNYFKKNLFGNDKSSYFALCLK